MTVLVPGEAIAARWHGALQGRLRRAPLEAFLRSHGLKFSTRGESQHSENIATAALFLVNTALAGYLNESDDSIAESQYPSLVQTACAVTTGIGKLIEEPGSWRMAALVCIGQILVPRAGMRTAARVAAVGVRRFESLERPVMQSVELIQIAKLTARAVQANDEEQLRSAVLHIAQHLAWQRFCYLARIENDRDARLALMPAAH